VTPLPCAGTTVRAKRASPVRRHSDAVVQEKHDNGLVGASVAFFPPVTDGHHPSRTSGQSFIGLPTAPSAAAPPPPPPPPPPSVQGAPGAARRARGGRSASAHERWPAHTHAGWPRPARLIFACKLARPGCPSARRAAATRAPRAHTAGRQSAARGPAAAGADATRAAALCAPRPHTRAGARRLAAGAVRSCGPQLPSALAPPHATVRAPRLTSCMHCRAGAVGSYLDAAVSRAGALRDANVPCGRGVRGAGGVCPRAHATASARRPA
jgi:hypothetical protein